MNKFHIINSGNLMGNDNILVVIHNAGFFSNCSIALQDIMIYYKENGRLPDQVDRTRQFEFYKAKPGQDLIPFYFEESDLFISDDLDAIEAAGHYYKWHYIPGHHEDVRITKQNNVEPQFSDYKLLDFDSMKPFIDKFFTPTQYIRDTVEAFIGNYQIDPANTCAVFYRGNDKNRETAIAPYQEFISKVREIEGANPGIRFLVQPDESEFWDAFHAEFPNSIRIEECKMISKQDSAVFLELPLEERPEHGKNFFASVLLMSKCKHLIMHSGNGGLWAVIYRGNTENVHQYLNGIWI